MFLGEKKSALDRLKRGLYSRTDVIRETPRHEIHEQSSDVPNSWNTDNSPQTEIPHDITPIRKVYHIGFIASLLFLLVTMAVGLYTFVGGKNFISADNVDILVEGPAAIDGGKPLALTVSVVNKNATDMELVDLIAEYPSGSKDPSDPAKDISKIRLSLGNIAPQAIAQKSFSSLMYGEEGESREIKFTAEYRTVNSNAIFFKEKVYSVSIASSPILVSVDAPENTLANQSTDIKITVASNSTATIKDVLLVLDFPFGFTLDRATPEATFNQNVWRIGDLAPGSKRIINLKGTFSGQDEEIRNIKAHVGIADKEDEKSIATNIITRNSTFTLEKPFFGLDLTLNGDRGDAVVTTGRTVRGEILWVNNGLTKITNARIEAKLSGNVLDKSSVSVSDGYYDSLTNTIIWEAGRTSGLDSIAPGAEGRLGFTFNVSDVSGNALPTSPSVVVSVSGKGNRIDKTGSPSDVVVGISRTAKVVSNLALSTRVLHYQGAIANTGPVPPRVDAVTTYTVVWTVTNTSNNITGARVTAALPPQVSWTSVIAPAEAGITYDSSNGTITWVVGAVPRNALVGSGARQVAFQVSLRPSANQIGTAPQIIGESTIVGTDTFANVTIKNTSPALTTRISTDASFKTGDDLVVQ